MTDIMKPFSTQGIRNFVARVGRDNIDNWFVLRRADAISYFGKDQYVTSVIGAFNKQIDDFVAQLPKEDKPVLDPSEEGMQIHGDSTDEK